MFADPLTVTINSVAKTLARVSTNGQSSIYQTSDGLFKLTISHQVSKDRVRSVVRIDQKKIATDPLTSEQDWATLTDYHVKDRPIVGFTTAEVQQLNAGLTSFVDNAVITKLVGGES
jgi:hypothetical protein